MLFSVALEYKLEESNYSFIMLISWTITDNICRRLYEDKCTLFIEKYG